MKKLICVLALGLCSVSSFASESALKAHSQQELEQRLEQSTQKHDTEMRDFLKSIDPKATQFTTKQSQRFCQITQGLINDMYAVLDQNRELLAEEDRSVTKREFITQAVYEAPDYQSLQKMGVNCKLK
ncbi:hypothetical protein E0H86_03430 [Acinetobacter sp. ANC 4635]|uniref:hypothetical protein n=1 Tax=Acinetobacter sp. ANC 4635 TaxID=2529846 RepID=UPI00103D49CF|nr:hypothetical protein [Acinetobacter sp. ANC 4635]TCB32520.1 hypothetical protein E0H86_03430 [Acinetobacter sp. ANC 4635]